MRAGRQVLIEPAGVDRIAARRRERLPAAEADQRSERRAQHGARAARAHTPAHGRPDSAARQ